MIIDFRHGDFMNSEPGDSTVYKFHQIYTKIIISGDVTQLNWVGTEYSEKIIKQYSSTDEFTFKAYFDREKNSIRYIIKPKEECEYQYEMEEMVDVSYVDAMYGKRAEMYNHVVIDRWIGGIRQRNVFTIISLVVDKREDIE